MLAVGHVFGTRCGTWSVRGLISGLGILLALCILLPGFASAQETAPPSPVIPPAPAAVVPTPAAAAAPPAEVGNPDVAGLPPKTLIDDAPLRPVPEWVQTNLRIGHLPGAGWRMVEEYAKAGYNVITVNTLTRWDRVGPSASMYPPNIAQEADEYLKRLVKTVHDAGAKSVFYLGPVQVPMLSPEFRAAHPDWLRVKPDGSKDTDFGNIRSGYVDWMIAQLCYLVKTYDVDGFWLDGLS